MQRDVLSSLGSSTNRAYAAGPLKPPKQLHTDDDENDDGVWDGVFQLVALYRLLHSMGGSGAN